MQLILLALRVMFFFPGTVLLAALHQQHILRLLTFLRPGYTGNFTQQLLAIPGNSTPHRPLLAMMIFGSDSRGSAKVCQTDIISGQ